VRRLLRAPLAAALLAVGLVGAGTLGARAAGLLESLELAAYDAYVRLAAGRRPADPRLVLVTIGDRDIAAQRQWPLADGTLARAIEIVAGGAPRAIGVDIYRDIPVPPGTPELESALTRHPHVVVVTKFAGGGSDGIPPPPAVRNPAQIGFNDMLVDPGGTVRRGLLFLDDGTTTFTSFALQLATLYLAPEGIALRADPGDPQLLRLGRVTVRPLEANDGGYVRADARGYQFLLDFGGGAAPFTAVALTDLLAGTVAPETFRDRVVLIGVTAQGVKDFFYTPLSRGQAAEQQMSGIALHAHVVSQLLRMALEGAAPMTAMREWLEASWILVWCAAGALVGLAVRSPWRFSLATGGGLLGLAAVDLAAFVGDWWLPLVPAALGGVAAAMVVTAYASYHERAERAVLMQLFSRHVSPEVADAIWVQREQFLDGGRPRPQKLVATILFTDLVGFTSLAEQLEPPALVDWLNEYMETMAREVIDHGGVINKYVGDSIMALFGVPVARTADAEVGKDAADAVECALAMEARLVELNRRWRRENQPAARMRIGIFTGPVVAGSIGSTRRLEYTVIGDTVNVASRLESYDKDLFPPDSGAHPCRILIGEATLAYVGSRFVTEEIGAVSLKGKEQPLGAYRVLGRAESPAAGRGPAERA
jgi:adenylate cyclase